MNISELIDRLTEIMDEHGDIPVGYDNCGYNGIEEVGTVQLCDDNTFINDNKRQPLVRLA